MRRTGLIALVLALVLVAAIVPACAKAPKEKILVIGTTDSPATLDPADAYDYFSSNVLNNTVEGLVAYEPGTSNLVPCLAESWTVSDDGLTYVFKIRQGVKFHDGTDLNAAAVKFSLDRARLAPPNGVRGDPGFLLDDIAEVQVTGDYEVTVKMANKSSPFLAKLGYTEASIISPTAYKLTEKMPNNIVGTGPYKFVEWVEQDHLTLVRNENYWGTPAFADKVVVKFFAESQALKLAVEKKEVDVGYRTFLPAEIASLGGNKELATLEGASPFIRYVVINVKAKPFDNVHVRKAISYSIDRKAIADQVYEGLVSPLYSLVPEGMWSYKPVFKDVYGETANLDKAKEELAAAGYTESKPLNIQFWYTPTHYGPSEADLAQVLKSQLEATGVIKVELQNSEWGRYTDDMVAGSMGIFLLGWYPDYLDPDDYTMPFLSTEGAKSFGSFYSKPEMDALILKETELTKVEERTPVFEQIQDKLAAEAPYIPLFQGLQFAVFQKNVKGIIADPVEIFRYYTIYKDGWK